MYIPDGSSETHGTSNLWALSAWVATSQLHTPGNEPDPHIGAKTIRGIYEYCGDVSGTATNPILWDIQQKTIVSNKSSAIFRIQTWTCIQRTNEVTLMKSMNSSMKPSTMASIGMALPNPKLFTTALWTD